MVSTLQVQSGPTFGEVEIKLPESMTIAAAEFEDLCLRNPELKAELSRNGDLIIMVPTGGTAGWRNLELLREIGNWARTDGSGIAFDSSTAFALPNGARRGPDAAWIRWERWDKLTDEEKDRFPPICPDFVVELRSKTDRLQTLQDKLVEFIENGVVLGLLIDPIEQFVHVYRPGAEPWIVEKPDAIEGDPELPGLTIELTRIWGDGR